MKSINYSKTNMIFTFSSDDETYFRNLVLNLLKEKGMLVRQFPTVSSKPLQMLRLYAAVQELGGCLLVEKWTTIAVSMDYSEQVTNGAFISRQKYLKYLFPIESDLQKIIKLASCNQTVLNKQDYSQRTQLTLEFRQNLRLPLSLSLMKLSLRQILIDDQFLRLVLSSNPNIIELFLDCLCLITEAPCNFPKDLTNITLFGVPQLLFDNVMYSVQSLQNIQQMKVLPRIDQQAVDLHYSYFSFSLYNSYDEGGF